MRTLSGNHRASQRGEKIAFTAGAVIAFICGYDSNGPIRRNLMTGIGAIYGQSAEIGRISYRIYSVGAYGHKVVGNR